MIMKLKEEARAHGGCRASEKKTINSRLYAYVGSHINELI
jgi:hypothetical protein